MDFSNRGFQASGRQNSSTQATGGNTASGSNGSKSNKKLSLGGGKLLPILSAVLLIGVVVLLLAVIIGVVKGEKNDEASLVSTDRYQAVFLEGGQVYFGKIAGINSEVIDLQDIFYLNVANGQDQADANAANNNISLVKLGCELHGPQDQMIVYRNQVTFWENLKDDGKVATAIKDWQEQNPNGQDCDNATSNTQQPTGTPSQNPANNSSESTPNGSDQ